MAENDRFTALAFSPDGRQIASGPKDKANKLRDTARCRKASRISLAYFTWSFQANAGNQYISPSTYTVYF
ncbi:hypothetical protein AFLA70_340g000840 [Aspergillus flavus AF70]|nr:hypothetical protein AFLA70_340g000840 [Aspergillus flavus AF70]